MVDNRAKSLVLKINVDGEDNEKKENVKVVKMVMNQEEQVVKKDQVNVCVDQAKMTS